MDTGTAREKVRVANGLFGLPLISKAFAEGRISYSKARPLTRIADAEMESCHARQCDALVDVARGYLAGGKDQLLATGMRVSRALKPMKVMKPSWLMEAQMHHVMDGSRIHCDRLVRARNSLSAITLRTITSRSRLLRMAKVDSTG